MHSIRVGDLIIPSEASVKYSYRFLSNPPSEKSEELKRLDLMEDKVYLVVKIIEFMNKRRYLGVLLTSGRVGWTNENLVWIS